MENYIVRIYRRANNRPEMLVGLVEKPESDESWRFCTIDELCNILVHRKISSEPNNPKQTIEQRRYRRFLLKEGSLLFDSRSIIGAVIEISMGGLSFHCLDAPELTDISIEEGTFRVEDGFCTESLPCRNLQDHAAPPESSSDCMVRTRCRVEFGELNPGQKMQLLHIIQNYTVSVE